MNTYRAPLLDVPKIKDLKQMLEISAEKYADKAAFLVKGSEQSQYKPVTYRKFKQDVDALGTALIDMDLKGGSIAVIGENRYEWAVSYMAAVCGVGKVVPLDKELPSHEIENFIEQGGVTAVLCSGKAFKSIAEMRERHSGLKYIINFDAKGELSFESLIGKGGELLKNGDSRFTSAKIDPEAPDILLFTSGTSGAAKGVMLCHRNICANIMDMCSMVFIDYHDTFLSVLPLHHTYECTCGFLQAVYSGCTVAYSTGLKHIPQNLAESQATVMLGVPLLFEAIYRKIWQNAEKAGLKAILRLLIRLSNLLKMFGVDITKILFKKIHSTLGGRLRLLVSGASAIDPAASKGLRDLGIMLIQGYGLTECSPILALNRLSDYKDEAAGLPLPHTEIRIDRPNKEGIGEICAKSPSVMLGYYNNPDESAKVFKDGWFHTGDLGYVDKQGFLYITGREKNVIVTKNGKNIYPEEVEKYLLRSKYILECMVYGHEDESGETFVEAQIVVNQEAVAEKLGKDYTPQQINALIASEVKTANRMMTGYKSVKKFYIREAEFSKTTTRKIKRYLEQNGG